MIISPEATFCFLGTHTETTAAWNWAKVSWVSRQSSVCDCAV